jgi:hypothetical protein
MLFAIAWNLLGDGLNDVLDPTAHYDFRRPPFWRRILRKRETQVVAGQEEPILTTGVPTEAASAQLGENESPPVHKLKYSDGTDPLLLAARENIASGNLPAALHAYQHLIRHDRMLGEILPDLAQLVQSNPHDPLVWQTLGDALAHTGDMLHARQSYERARKLRS